MGTLAWDGFNSCIFQCNVIQLHGKCVDLEMKSEPLCALMDWKLVIFAVSTAAVHLAAIEDAIIGAGLVIQFDFRSTHVVIFLM